MQKLQQTNFGSGPCSKYFGWAPPKGTYAGRSHRSPEGLSVIQDLIALQRKILRVPSDYYLGILSGSNSGGIEAAMWTLLGARGVDVIAHCVFSNHWEHDIKNELKLPDVRSFKAGFAEMADVSDVDFDRDVVFCWTSTTSGVSFQNADWIAKDRKGLTICDAASAAFIFDFDWSKLDATAFAWQKGPGGEAGASTLVLSPRAIERLESYEPSWPVPRLFRIASNKKVNFKIFEGYTINTPSMLCIEDFHNILTWVEKIGGLDAMIARVQANYSVLKEFISRRNPFEFLVKDENKRAHHIACLDIASAEYQQLNADQRWDFLKKMYKICHDETGGNDFLGYIFGDPNLRIWAGPTIESSELEKLLLNLEHAYEKVK